MGTSMQWVGVYSGWSLELVPTVEPSESGRHSEVVSFVSLVPSVCQVY